MKKPEQLVNFDRSIGKTNAEVESDRRTFIQGLGIAVLTLQCRPLIAHPAEPPTDGEGTSGNLIIQSGPGLFDHVHDLLIPYALLKAPPLKGVQLTSTQAMLHQHQVALSQKELMIVNQGGTVTQRASSHLFVIALARRKG